MYKLLYCSVKKEQREVAEKSIVLSASYKLAFMMEIRFNV